MQQNRIEYIIKQFQLKHIGKLKRQCIDLRKAICFYMYIYICWTIDVTWFIHWSTYYLIHIIEKKFMKY